MNGTQAQTYINHIVLVLDESASMRGVASELVKVADNQIAYLAQRSRDLDQETRITVYAFNGYPGAHWGAARGVRCLPGLYDKDVLRMPSIAGFYRPEGNTPLIDATMLALSDLKMTPEKYGEHAFLIYVLTDGQENASRAASAGDLKHAIASLQDHWTVAAFVPDQTAKFEAKKFGFPADNIAIWDATTAAGVAEAGEIIRQTTDDFMTGRARGIRGSRSLFKVAEVSAADVKRALTPMTKGSYFFTDVAERTPIDRFCREQFGVYEPGKHYYQLAGKKPVVIQGHKEIWIEADDGHVYCGPMRDVRHLLGLGDTEEKVRPGQQKDTTVFVQSKSYNRVLEPGTRLLTRR